jgi:hypothetical protein
MNPKIKEDAFKSLRGNGNGRYTSFEMDPIAFAITERLGDREINNNGS